MNTFNKSGVVQHAVDGSSSGDWFQHTCSSTTRATDPWWRVDLGKSYLVDEVFILNRADCCRAELQGFEIRIGDTLENKGNSNPKCGDLHNMANTDKKSFYCNPAIRGRFVNIRIPGASKILTLCEVIVNPNPTVNIAFEKTAAQSSKHNAAGSANKAVDGNSDGLYAHKSCTHTTNETEPWWRVDLGTSKPVSEVFIVNRVNVRERLNNAEVRVGDVLDNNGKGNPVCERFAMISWNMKSVYCKPRRTGRYVTVRLRGADQILTLCEVSVYSESKALLRDKPRYPTPVPVYIKYPVKLTCPEAFGFPVPHVTWMFNGSVLQNSTTELTLHLNSTPADQDHNIECVATNKHGADYHQFQVRVLKSRFFMCTDYKDIGQKNRGIQFKITDSNEATTDSSTDENHWVRFVDSGSPRQLPESCVAPWSCGTQAPGWLSGKHPSEEDNVVQRTVCFSWNGRCCAYRTSVLVRKCYGHYVYKLKATEFPVKARYCTDVQKYQEHDDVLFTSPLADQHYGLLGHVIHSEVNVSETVRCMACCLVEKNCASFNYYPGDKLCELNNAARLQDLNNFKPTPGSKYFEKTNNMWMNVWHP